MKDEPDFATQTVWQASCHLSDMLVTLRTALTLETCLTDFALSEAHYF